MSVLEQITQIEQEADALRLRGDEPGYIAKMREATQKREELVLQAEEEALQRESEERVQKQAEHIDGLMDAVLSLGLFEAIEPKPEDGERIHEYDERRKEFYLILHDFVKEQQQSLINVHNAELAQKDEKIRVLTAQGIETENLLAGARKEATENYMKRIELEAINSRLEEEANAIIGDLNDAHTEISRLKLEYDGVCESSRKAQEEYYKAQNEIAELQSKLEQANKPKEHKAPSESIQSRVASLAVKSQKEFDADEIMKRFQERQANGGKVNIDLPVIGAPRESFREEDHHSDSRAANDILPEENVNQFPDSTVVQGHNVDEGHVDGEVEGKTVEERITELEAKVERIERQIGLERVAS